MTLKTLYTTSGLYLLSLTASSQTPTHIDQGTNDPSVNIWDDPEYILLLAAIIILGFIFLFFRNRLSRRKRID